jgi:TonB family protein
VRREPAFAFAALLCVGFAAGQQAAPPTPPSAADSQSGAMAVYYAGPGVTAPSLLPITFTDVVASGQCKKLDGTAELSAFVDAQGIPRYVFLLQPIGNNLDKVAIYIADADRFNPGTRNGQPAAVAATIKASIQSCIEEKNDEHGQKIHFLQLRSMPQQQVDLQRSASKDASIVLDGPTPAPTDNSTLVPYKVGGRVSAPILLKSGEVEYSDYARKQKISGVCIVSLIVDASGMPQNVHLVKSLESGLDQNAINAVSQYRFKPAMKNGTTPVPVQITVTVDFRLYN